MVGREGIEPPTRRASTYRSSIWAIDPNQGTFFKIGFEPITFRLQTNALPIELLLAHAKELLSVPLIWSSRQGSNLRPIDYKSIALPTELQKHIKSRNSDDF